MASKAQARVLGAELRELRRSTGLTMTEASNRAGWSKSRMSLTETGKRLPSAQDVATLLAVLGITGSRRDTLIQMAREAAIEPRWLGVGLPGVASQVTGMAELERTSTRITAVSPHLIPGLMQTADYARAIFEGSDVAASEVTARVNFRMGRQRILDGPDPVQYTALLEEAVLRRPVGGVSVILSQIDRLIELAARPNCTIQVLPIDFGWSDALEGPFVVLEGEKTHPVVHLEHKRSGLFLDEDDADEVQAYLAAAANLQTMALSPIETTDFLVQCRDDWRRQHDDTPN